MYNHWMNYAHFQIYANTETGTNNFETVTFIDTDLGFPVLKRNHWNDFCTNYNLQNGITSPSMVMRK